MAKVPYIGIDDFSTYQQVDLMLDVFNTYKPKSSKRKLHVGVMMTYETLRGLKSEWSNLFPPKEAFAEIFSSEETMNCPHYANYNPEPELWKSIAEVIDYSGKYVDALQLDVPWPDIAQVTRGLSATRKPIKIILQIGTKSLKQANNDPREVVRRLREYKGYIDYVLLDKSMGQGAPMDSLVLMPYLRAIRKAYPDLGLAVAGGLGPDTMHLVRPIADIFRDISIDACGKLRDSGNPHDPINWIRAIRYLQASFQILR